jgi:triacylglycerol esterase/lipase EstA (alpha/beta hydrolase family)
MTGVKIYPMGSSPKTKSYTKGQCGFDAVENLLPLETVVATRFSYFKYIKELLVNAGYMVGLNFQVLPYDWRLGLKENGLNLKFERVVDEVYEMFGKKISLIAHSMGNYQVMNYLYKMP